MGSRLCVHPAGARARRPDRQDPVGGPHRNGRVEDRLRTLAAGYGMHVPKPVDPAELATIVASLAGRT